MLFARLPTIVHEGRGSKNRFAFRHCNPEELLEGKAMRDHLRFAAAYWRAMCDPLSDPFGAGAALMPWDDGAESVADTQNRARVFFGILENAGITFYCVHDRDVAPEMDILVASPQPCGLTGESPTLSKRATQLGILGWDARCKRAARRSRSWK